MRNILTTAALPYANGELHLGHLLEYVQPDIWCRAQRAQGHTCNFVCGSDMHGTPIMLKAQEQGVAPEDMVESMAAEHLNTLEQFNVQFAAYHSTHSPINKALVADIYQKLKANGDIAVRDVEQAFDEEKQMFLPDRFVKGTCPTCKAPDQYGDSCEACGATYDPLDLTDAVSSLSGTTPIKKVSEHYFFALSRYEDMLQAWLKSSALQPEVANKLGEWFEAGLTDWDISRDAPYFGFKIPGTDDKYFYVWLDAPIGYLAAFKKLCDEQGLDFDAYWKEGSTHEVYHFIGKDITYFHALFWPAVLTGAGMRKPTGVYAHGFLTIDGKKMSKSRGTFVQAKDYLAHLNPEHLRYYFAAKLGSGLEDIDLNLEDFRLRVNSDLVGKYVNIASRSAGFLRKQFDNTLSDTFIDEALWQAFVDAKPVIIDLYNKREFNHGVRAIMALADKANQFVDHHAPWKLAKEEGNEAKVHQVCSQAINMFYALSIYLAPILPETAAKVMTFLNVDSLDFDAIDAPLKNHVINTFKPLMFRVEEDSVNLLTT
jgi:methionyl-tRNA synthetase